MKLRNKKTGKVIEWFNNTDDIFPNTLAELNEEWEDYEEPKDHYYIDYDGDIMIVEALDYEPKIKAMKQIGNYFESQEEAEKAVERLCAWKRLKDKGFRFEGIKEDYTRILQSQDPFRTGKRYLQFNKSEDEEWMQENWNDLDLLFGGEE